MFSLSPSPRMGLSWIWQDSVCVTGSPLFRSGVVYASISDHCVCRSLCLCLTICTPDSSFYRLGYHATGLDYSLLTATVAILRTILYIVASMLISTCFSYRCMYYMSYN